MLTYVRNKLLNNKWMTISLLIGNLLLIAIAATSPIYQESVLQRLLQNNFTRQLSETQLSPGTIEFRGNYTTAGLGKMDYSATEKLEAKAADFCDDLKDQGISIVYNTTEYYMPDQKLQHEGEAIGGIMSGFNMRIDSLQDMEDHITILNGTFPSAEMGEGNVMEAIVNETTLMTHNMYVGETLAFPNLKDSSGKYYFVKIVGTFTSSDSTDSYWTFNPNTVDKFVFLNYDLFRDTFVKNDTERRSFYEAVFVTMDFAKLRGSDVDPLVTISDKYIKDVDELFLRGMNVRAYNVLTGYQDSARRLQTTLWVLEVPIFLLLAAFIFMVSGQMLSIDQAEISMIKSRGASRKQILTLYLLQSLIISGAALIIALPLAFFICQVIGSSNAFLEFVQRRALSMHFTWEVLLYSLLAVVISVLAMLIPVISYSKVGIVEAKRTKHKKQNPLWQKMFLDVILLGVSLYGFYNFSRQSEFLVKEIASGASLDPMLYLCSSLFMLGCAMLFVRIFPWIVGAIFNLFKKIWSPGLYASFLRILRSKGNQSFIMIFLVLTMALGIFSAETARTINSNAEEMIRYQNGADLVVKEHWSASQIAGEDGETTYVYSEPLFDKYLDLEEAASISKVFLSGGFRVAAGTSKPITGVTLMGIHTKSFGETVYFKEGLLPQHINNYLNAISQEPNAVLLSTAFRDTIGLKLGDKISLSSPGHSNITGIVYGFVDYWPSLTPPFKAEEGSQYFIIANIGYLQSSWGVEPYQVWIRNAGNSSSYIYEFAAETETSFVEFTDTSADIVELKNDPIFQATNGILTVGFIVVLMLCSVGFLIYWILSIRSRQLQFGIFRAMGMTMGEIIGMLVNEQIWLSLVSIIVGALVGKLASGLYVPLISITYSAENQMIPLEMVSRQSDEVQLYMVVGGVMILCMVILAHLIRKIKIAQALKLGED